MSHPSTQPQTLPSSQPCSPFTSEPSEIQTCDSQENEKQQSVVEQHERPRKNTEDTLVGTVGFCPSDQDPESGISRQATGTSMLEKFKSPLRRLSDAFSGKKKAEPELNPSCIDYHPMGYPRLAACINSDENFMMCRRYGFLHTRVMLYRQDELRQLEDDLIALDKDDAENDPRALMSRERDDMKVDPERKHLIDKIEEKLEKYDHLVLRSRKMASLPTVTERNFKSVSNWVEDERPLFEREASFISKEGVQGDFVAMVDPKEGGWFDALIEDTILPLIPRKVAQMLFSDPCQRISTSDDAVNLYSKDRIDTFARILITIIAVALLMAPVVVLFSNEETGAVKIAVILLFTLFFSAALSVFTKAKRHEVFAATAAYCAVLVVFLGNFN